MGRRAMRRTCVGHGDLAGLTDDFGDILGILDSVGYAFFKLRDVECAGNERGQVHTKDIFTDCESACDSDSFVLRNDEHRIEARRDVLTCSSNHASE